MRACGEQVVLSTNVAETCITIEDVVFIIDTGRCHETGFDPSTGLSRLSNAWISRAAARQRSGRAGRVRPGVCFRLYSRRTAAEMAPHQEAEMYRVPLDQLCLQVLLDCPPQTGRRNCSDEFSTQIGINTPCHCMQYEGFTQEMTAAELLPKHQAESAPNCCIVPAQQPILHVMSCYWEPFGCSNEMELQR
jgi:hypothetical protein